MAERFKLLIVQEIQKIDTLGVSFNNPHFQISVRQNISNFNISNKICPFEMLYWPKFSQFTVCEVVILLQLKLCMELLVWKCKLSVFMFGGCFV